MPAILVGSKMKSGLPKPKPVHSALPIPQNPSRLSALALAPAPLKTHIPSLGQQAGSGPPRSPPPGSEASGNTQEGDVFLEGDSAGRVSAVQDGSVAGYQGGCFAVFVKYWLCLATPVQTAATVPSSLRFLSFSCISCHREPVGTDKQVIVSGAPRGIDAAEAVRLTQSAPSLSGNEEGEGQEAHRDLLGLDQAAAL
ncbi:hypothetical protein PAMP_000175 [Pampus punctatissimus]